MEKNYDRKLVLEDGSIYEGYGFGCPEDKYVMTIMSRMCSGSAD